MSIELAAGNLSIFYENGALRYISSGKTELLRMIYAAVRDRNWKTIIPQISDEKIRTADKSFRISYSCLYKSGEMIFSSNYVIEGNMDNSLVLSMEGEAVTSFEKNRIGFCVLHPIEGCAGKPCIISHTDGSAGESLFPEEISPHQVFRDIKSMTWPAENLNCTIDFEGDVFETEDQRNWTDASYKTYSTPLSIPFPVILGKGTRIFQKIYFRVSGQFDTKHRDDKAIVVKLLPEDTFKIPPTGICRPVNAKPCVKADIRILRNAGFDHYRVDLHLFDKTWPETAGQAYNESIDLGTPIEFALFFDDNARSQIDRFLRWYSAKRPSISAILLFHKDHPSTPDPLAGELISILRNSDPDLKIATGTNANFAQLNRFRPGDTGNDFVCYSTHPQEHASDDATLVENLRGQEYSVKSARKIAGDKGIIISPVTIQRRFNANITFIETPAAGGESNPQSDGRLMSLFGACWTAGSLKYLCESGADSISYFETSGERGIIRGSADSKTSALVPSYSGNIYPVYHVFRYLLRNKDLKGIKSVSSKPLVAESIALSDGRQAKLILVNFTGSVQPVKLECCSDLFRITPLNSDNVAAASKNCRWTGNESRKTVSSKDTFTIEPYSINFIEGWLKH